MANARIFQHNNFSGRQVLIDNPGHQRYLLSTFGFLNGLNFNDITSSVRLATDRTDIQSMCILFQHARFDGDFKCFAYNNNRDIASLPGFNDVVSSVLLIDHDQAPNRTVLNIRDLAGNRINQAIDDRLNGINEVTRSGNVLLKFTIDLFEVSQFGRDLVLAEVPIRVHTPWPFGDYNAKIRYWVDLFINTRSQVQARVVAWGYWIEGGILTGSIEGRLRPQVQANIGPVETELNNMLRELDWHRWTDVYLLPGRASGISSDYDGHLDDDVSIVLPYN